jgi:hypothetical protein
MLAQFGEVEAIEVDPPPARWRAAARPAGGSRAAAGAGWRSEPPFDLIGAFDVIEHIDDDPRRWRIAGASSPAASFVMTVPAHQWMWSAHDVVNHHKRRYSKRGLKRWSKARR